MSFLPPNSPLFTPLQLAPVSSNEQSFLPQLPEKPLASSGSVQLYVIPTEKTLFFQGFEAAEYSERQPILLRGCLFLRILKPAKIKSITLSFKGLQRTDWPEGIPPKKNVFYEENEIINHTWPFYSMSNPLNMLNGGADLYSELPKSIDRDISHLNLNDSGSLRETISRSHSPTLNQLDPSVLRGLRKAATSPQLNPVDLFSDLQSIKSVESEIGKPGTFQPGDYIYNFEHPLRPSLPETTSVTFGEVSYELEASLVRSGAFKLNLLGKLPINLVRTPSETNLEENEPIVITRDWEDQLRYDIVIGGKSIVLDSYIPLAFRFVPLWGKVALHRIRVYLTENLEYYCQNKKVHRMEPPKKYLLLEHKAKKGKSLLTKKENGEYGDETAELLPRELEFQLYVPQTLNGKVNHVLHPDTSFEEIQAHHWIKLCLRISRTDPENPDKRKHYEISIDSPIHILSPYSAHGNTLLPAYDSHMSNDNFLPEYTPSSPPLSPDVVAVDNTQTIGKLFSVLHRRDSGSSAKSKEADEAIAQAVNDRFYHLNSPDNNDEPIERDANIHLEANMYKPNPSEAKSPINSPQAMPFSPLNSPLIAPIAHSPMVQSSDPPSMPPPFEVTTPLDETLDVPPPAYEEEELSRGSSVRDSSSSLAMGSRDSSSALDARSRTSSNVRDMLTTSFHRNSVASKKSQSSGDTKRSEEDIVNLVSPELVPDAVSPRHALSPASPRALSPADSPVGPSRPISPIVPIPSISTATLSPTDLQPTATLTPPSPQPFQPPQPSQAADSEGYQSSTESTSRRTSITSEISNELGQKIPLLGASTQSLLQPRTASVGSVLLDTNRRLSSSHRPSIVDFVDGGDLGGNFMSHLNLQKPKRNKHIEKGASEGAEYAVDDNMSDVPGLKYEFAMPEGSK